MARGPTSPSLIVLFSPPVSKTSSSFRWLWMMALTTNYDHVYAESTSRYAGHDETDNQVRAVESVSYLCACLELEAVEGFAKTAFHCPPLTISK